MCSTWIAFPRVLLNAMLAAALVALHPLAFSAQVSLDHAAGPVRLEVPDRLMKEARKGDHYLLLTLDAGEIGRAAVPILPSKIFPLTVHIQAIKKASKVGWFLADVERLTAAGSPFAPRLQGRQESFDVYAVPGARDPDRGERWFIKRDSSGNLFGVQDPFRTSRTLRVSRNLSSVVELRYQVDKQHREEVDAIDATVVAIVRGFIRK